MTGSRREAPVPVSVRVEVHPGLDVRVAEASDSLEEYCTMLASDLGLPVVPHISMTSDESVTSRRGYRIFIDDEPCRVPWAPLASVDHTALPAVLGADLFANRDLLLGYTLMARLQRDPDVWGIARELSASGRARLLQHMLGSAVSLARLPDLDAPGDHKGASATENWWEIAEMGRSESLASGVIVPRGNSRYLPTGQNSLPSIENLVGQYQTALEGRVGLLLPTPTVSVEGSWLGIRVNDARIPVVHSTGVVNAKESGDAGWTADVAGAIHRSAHLLVSVEAVQLALAALSETAEKLYESAMLRLPMSTVTEVIRALVSEKVSVRDLRSVLEAMLRLRGRSTADDATRIVFPAHLGVMAYSGSRSRDEPLSTVDYAAAVRVALGLQLKHDMRPWESTIGVHLLDQKLEERLPDTADSPLSREETQSMVDAVGGAVGSEVTGVHRSIVVTAASSRHSFRERIHIEHPNVDVLAYNELPAESNVQALSSISLA